MHSGKFKTLRSSVEKGDFGLYNYGTTYLIVNRAAKGIEGLPKSRSLETASRDKLSPVASLTCFFRSLPWLENSEEIKVKGIATLE